MTSNEKGNPLIGKIVSALFMSEGGGALRFDLDDGTSVVVRADGDCCSHTWIENVQGVEQLIGSKVVAVEDVGKVREEGRQDDEVILFYGCKITSEKGFALIDYRNESNGYYGGNLAWPDDSFYGGVYGQNGSTEGWREVVS